MLFLLIAKDSTEPALRAKRASARERHLRTVEAMAADGTMRFGGAYLDDKNEPEGSIAILDFPSRADVDRWLADHPYRRLGIWTDIEVWPVRPAPFFTDDRNPA